MDTSYACLIIAFLCTSIQFQTIFSSKMIPGGTTDEKAASGELQNIVDSVRGKFEEKTGRHFKDFTAVKYKSQVVAGTNYFVKVQVDTNEYVHVRIFVSLPMNDVPPEAVSIQQNRTLEEPINYF